MHPSAFGYKTSEGLTRYERQGTQNREMREQRAIIGTTPNPHNMNPLRSLPDSAGFASETARLRTNAAAELRAASDAKRENQKQIISRRAHSREVREMDFKGRATRDADKYERESRELAGTNVRNRGSVGYNLVTGQAINPVEQERTNHRQAMLAHSVRTRTQILDAKANSTSYNVITGEDRPRVVIPPKPAPL